MLRFVIYTCLITAVPIFDAGVGWARQSDVRGENRRVADPDTAPLIYNVEAYGGQPFGVGTFRYRMCEGDELIDRTGATLLSEKNGRVFYPVFSRSASAKFFQNILGGAPGLPDSMHTVWFLFRGDQPLELVLQGACEATKTAEVEFPREKKFQRLLGQWWKEYNSIAEKQEDWGDYPPLIEAYLKSMLSRRLSLPIPGDHQQGKDPLAQSLALIFDLESLRREAIEDAMAGLADIGTAVHPLPSDIFWKNAELNAADFRDVELEPFADCVPAECFYLRFGTWGNQIWLKRLMAEFGGDLGRMITLRGYKPRVPSKFLNQLAIQSTEFDQLFGGNLIDDVAVIGNDMFFADGAAVGILLHARNSQTLRDNLTAKRAKFSADNVEFGCTVEDVDLDGTCVQFLKTPDNRYRSFYVVEGDNHLITSSISLARRFIEAAGGEHSLAQSSEFRYARQQMPLSRDDTVFIFVPSRLLQNLLGPHYQIELARRNRSITDMQIVELASLAAENEGYDAAIPENLVTHGFLPQQFGKRPDGSQLHRFDDYWVDSIRGRRGFFVPIPDVELAAVTDRELSWYAERRKFLTDNLSQLDPMFVGLKRYQHENNIERIVYDARVAPFGQQKYGWLFSMLGEPMTQHVVGSPSDLISFQASLRDGSINRRMPPCQVFGAIQDELETSTEITSKSFFGTLELVRNAPGYIGTWPPTGYLDWLTRLRSQTSDTGLTYLRLIGLWRLQEEKFSALAFDRDRLIELQQHIKMVPAERPAQIRFDVRDLANSRLRNWANVQNYRRSWETSIANTRLLNMMSQQFELQPAAARATAESLLDVNLVCSLGGDYQLVESAPNRLVWHSTAWPDFAEPVLPENYTSPLLTWFRGLLLEGIVDDSQFSVHGFLDIERSGTTSLPGFEMFRGFSSIFGSKKYE